MQSRNKMGGMLKELNFGSPVSAVQEKPIKKKLNRLEMLRNLQGGLWDDRDRESNIDWGYDSGDCCVKRWGKWRILKLRKSAEKSAGVSFLCPSFC